MANKESQLNLRLTAQNDATTAFEALSEAVKSMMSEISSAASAIEESFRSIMSSASTSAEGTTKSLDGTVTAFDSEAKAASEAATSMDKSFQSIEEGISAVVMAIRKQTTDVTTAMGEIEKGVSTGSSNAKKSLESLGGIVALQMLGQSLEELGQKGEHVFDFAIEQGADFQQSMRNIQTVMAANVTTSESWNQKMQDSAGLTQQLQDLALSLGSRGAQSANQIAEAMDTMMRAGVDGKTVLEGAAQAAQDVAIVTGDNIDEAANLVTEIFHMYREQFAENGKSMVQNMTEVGNTLTGTLLSARINSQDFINTLKYVGPVASEVGASLTDTATATALLAQYGIKGSQAGTTLRRMFTNLISPTEKQAEALSKLGIIQNGHNLLIDESTGKMKSFADVQSILHDRFSKLSNVQQMAYAQMIFGQYALAGSSIMANVGADAFSNLKDKIAGISAQNAANSMLDTFQGHMQQLTAHVQTAAKEFGMSFLPILERLIPIGNRLLDWLQSLSPQTKTVMMGILGVGSALAVVGGAIATFGVTLKFLREGFIAFNELFKITQMAGAVVGAFRAIAASIEAVSVAEAIMDALNPIGWISLIVAAVIGLSILIYKYWDQIKSFTIEAWSAIKDFLMKWGADILMWIPLGPFVLFVIQHWDQIKTVTAAMWDGVKRIFMDAFNFIYPLIVGSIKAQIEFYKASWESIKAVFSAAWQAIKVIFSTSFLILYDIVTGKWSDIGNVFQHARDKLSGIMGELGTKLKSIWTEAWSNIEQYLVDAYNKMIGVAANGTKDIGQAIYDGWKAIKQFFLNLPSEALQWGENMVQGFISGVEAMAQRAIQTVSNLVHNLVNTAKSVLDIHSPSVVFHDIGQNVAQGLTNGIAAGQRSAQDAMNKMSGSLATTFSTNPQITALVSGSRDVGMRQMSGVSGGTNSTVNFHQGAIQINVNGANKNGAQIANDVMSNLRQQVKLAIR